MSKGVSVRSGLRTRSNVPGTFRDSVALSQGGDVMDKSIHALSEVQTENANLNFALGERDIENERLKTTVMALNEKMALMMDIDKDL